MKKANVIIGLLMTVPSVLLMVVVPLLIAGCTDQSPPVVGFAGPNPLVLNSSSAILKFTATDNHDMNLTYSVFVSGTQVANGTMQNAANVTIPLSFTTGTSSFLVKAQVCDQSHNCGQDQVNVTISIPDLTAPVVTILSIIPA